MNVMVLGGMGAVGKPLSTHLAGSGHNIVIADRFHASEPNAIRCDIADYRQAESLVSSVTPEVVYLLAAEFGRNNGEDYYEQLWQSNAVGTKNLIRLQEQHGFRMVFFSSSEVYGDWDGVMTEDVMMQHPIRQLNDYAISKWVNEQQIMNSADRFGTETVRVRLFNTYGPGEHYTPYRSVICQFVYRALHDLPYTVYLDHHRTSSYIDDTVRTLGNIADNFRPGTVYNISGDEYHDIKFVSDTILGILGKDDSRVEYVKKEAHNTLNKKSDNARAKADLGHEARVGLVEGIERTIDWQKSVYGV